MGTMASYIQMHKENKGNLTFKYDQSIHAHTWIDKNGWKHIWKSDEYNVYHNIIKPDPAIEKTKKEAEEKAERLLKEKEEAERVEAFAKALEKQFNNVLEGIGKLELNEKITKVADEQHISFIGPVSTGKTTLQNVLYGLDCPVALGHCTTKCEVVHTEAGLVVWDMPGEDLSFKYYRPETLNFIKSLDKCVVLFDSDIAAVSWTIKVVYAINPGALVIARTKVDQCGTDSERTIEEERESDGKKVQELLGLDAPFKTYCLSSHNMRDKGEQYDWEEFQKTLK